MFLRYQKCVTHTTTYLWIALTAALSLLVMAACNGNNATTNDTLPLTTPTSSVATPMLQPVPTEPDPLPTMAVNPLQNANTLGDINSPGVLYVSNINDGFYQIFALATEGEERTKVLTGAEPTAGNPQWSPDGRKIMYLTYPLDNPLISREQEDIWVMDADGANPINLTQNPAADYEATWSPDSEWIAFTSDRKGNLDVFVIRADGSEIKALTNHLGIDRSPSWSPTGSKIAFTSEQDSSQQIYHIDLETNETNLVTRRIRGARSPKWSPDGDKIAFISEGMVWLIDVDGENEQVISWGVNEVSAVHWAPDGSKLVFDGKNSTRIDRFRDAYLYDVREERLQQITRNDQVYTVGSWNPAGTHIVLWAGAFSTASDLYIANMEEHSLFQITRTRHEAHVCCAAWQPSTTP